MSGFTITAGVSFSGGFTMTDGPAPAAPENTAAWFGGGYLGGGFFSSTVDRITFATDTDTASARGPLSAARKGLAAAGNTTDAWFGGGAPSSTSTVQRITFATDTATAAVRGPLSSGTSYLAAAGNTTDGWFGGGRPAASPFSTLSTVDRITFATDTDTASVRGLLSVARSNFAAAGNTDYAWFASGSLGPAGRTSTVDRITFATDTATATARGPLSQTRSNFAAAGNTTDGWFAGGNPAQSLVDRITYATDTATASVRGPLSANRYNLAAGGNETDGWFGGGRASSFQGLRSTVDRITFATDTATASVRGPLSAARYGLAAAGGIQ